MTLDGRDLPPSAQPLLSIAERWGIGDDIERENAVRSATPDELAALAHALDHVDGDFWDWLAGPASRDTDPTREYLAFTALTMAVDSARVKIGSGA